MKTQSAWGLSLSLVAASLATPVAAAPTHIEEFVITASPHGKRVDEVPGAIAVLDQQQLQREVAATLGETLRNEPGINSSSFGPGVGAPVIRGLGGKRVEILHNGTGVADAADVSPDHAIGSEPLLADRIEILRGPATLRFGPGAIGGVVNVIDNSIHTEQVEGFQGAGEARHNTNNHENALVGRLDGGNGPFTYHLSGVLRDSRDASIPGRADRGDEDSTRGHIANSDGEADSWTLGTSWVTDKLVAGIGVSRLNNAYGIPPGGHGHGGHDEGESQGDDEHHDDQGIEEDHGDELFTRIDLAQTVYQGKLLARGLEGFVQQVRIDLSRTDYGHRELEIAGDEREVGTRFDVTGNEARGEITHAPLAGWTGTLGLHYTDRDFAAEGLEAFVPPSDTRGLGIYLIEDLAIGAADLELGLRHDRQRITTSGLDAIDHDSVNASASLLYPLADSQRLGLILSRSERAPVAEELLSAGEHVATRSYEVGNPGLDTESAWNAELNWTLSGEPLEASVSLYHRRFADFIHGADDGSRFSHDREADGLAGAAACSTDLADFDNDAGEFDEALPCLFYRQADARFSGVEAELTLPITTNQTLGLWADQVRARFDDGGDVPRIPPLRVGAHWDYSQGPWSARLSVTRAADQDRAGANQTATDGYTRVDAFVRYGQGGWALFLKGFNLTDADIRNATSFLREIAPEPGRGMVVGASYEF